MKVICENYKKCDEACLHRNPHGSNDFEKSSCAKNKLFCAAKRLELICICVENFKVFPVIHNPLFKGR